jgi:hypothetical protein
VVLQFEKLITRKIHHILKNVTKSFILSISLHGRSLLSYTPKTPCIRNVFSAENSSSAPAQNSKHDLLLNCFFFSPFALKSVKISFSAVERSSGVF